MLLSADSPGDVPARTFLGCLSGRRTLHSVPPLARQAEAERAKYRRHFGWNSPPAHIPSSETHVEVGKQTSASSRVKACLSLPCLPLETPLPNRPRHGVHEACFVSPGGCSKSSIFRLPRRRSISGLCDFVGLEYIHYIQHHDIVTCNPSFSFLSGISLASAAFPCI